MSENKPISQIQSSASAANNSVSRRNFVQWCGAAALAMRTAQSEQALQRFGQVRLLGSEGQALKAEHLQPEREYVFFYPYVSTPCFLLRLNQPTAPQQLHTATGEAYQWQGGVGPNRDVVAFVAICTHKLTHPSKAVSFIGYRPQSVGFLGQNNQVERRAAVIQCCSEHSIYDPAQGCRVLAGPAPQPLGGVALEEQGGELIATGVYGGLVYERFFERFGFRLDLEFGNRAREAVVDHAQVMPIEDFAQQRIQC
jgi:Rieske Fe-S protein